eukprot:CAMPEP_0119266916 /NCGR_PEP_ID=MMETSP1329-20130426/5247_1 /TAXON_ID=114041 /ORGANISM="Genus nov. species nov., Strain RCC1024" /LENGTH=52 /DNA_ID=CAMNT_0007266821 /DNA_START=111 /DNA_END=265 /DNA_ORIENTATION=+
MWRPLLAACAAVAAGMQRAEPRHASRQRCQRAARVEGPRGAPRVPDEEPRLV